MRKTRLGQELTSGLKEAVKHARGAKRGCLRRRLHGLPLKGDKLMIPKKRPPKRSR